MFRRLIFIGQQNARQHLFGATLQRRFHKEDADNIVLIPGGGLMKFQGSIKEEKYFNDQDIQLLAKMKADGAQNLKYQNVNNNWSEFDKVLKAGTEPTAYRETCSLNKYKNCLEEAYFMTEQTENFKQLKDKCLQDQEVDDEIDVNNAALT